MAKKKTGKGSYPWDVCMTEQTARYGSTDTAKRVCGSIKAKYGNPAGGLQVDVRPDQGGFQFTILKGGKTLAMTTLPVEEDSLESAIETTLGAVRRNQRKSKAASTAAKPKKSPSMRRLLGI